MGGDGVGARGAQLFVLALLVLALQVVLTRIFSHITFHHFTYLVISVAMLGFGAAGSYLTVRGRAPAEDDGEFVAVNAARFAGATLAALVVVPRIYFFPYDIYRNHDYSNLISLLLIVGVAGLPFFFAGNCIGRLISRAGAQVHRLYFADLTGAAAGCLLVIALVNGPGASAACAILAAGALVVSAASSRRRRLRYALGAAGAGLLALGLSYRELLPMYVPDGKQMFRKEHLIEWTKWHVVTRLDATVPLEQSSSLGGALSRTYDGPPQTVRYVYQDGSNLTGIVRPTPTPERTASLGYYLQAAPYVVTPEARALVIGCGGGIDILIALYHGAPHVVGVDLNPDMIGLLTGRYREFSGDLAARHDVELVVAEGRHFLTRDPRRFDVIQLSGVDTFAALATGAYALSENYVYTMEAHRAYLAHLTPDGVLNFSRPFFEPREALKLVATQLAALEELAVERPSEHLVVVVGAGVDTDPWVQTMVKRSPFTPAQVARLSEWARRLDFALVYDPYTPRDGEIERLIRAAPAERRALIAAHPRNIAPATDDRPFFFQFYRWRDLLSLLSGGSAGTPPLALLILLGSLAQIVALSGLFILYPLLRRGSEAARRGARAGIFTYFAALGLGFILIEIVLLQKLVIFLGGPAYSMSITLFTILLTSGVGSFAARRWGADPMACLNLVVPLLVLCVAAEAWLLDFAVPRLMGLSHVQRAGVTVALVAPLGFLMGMPFPTGLRLVDLRRPELAPWAWGINACATVAGSMLCILLSMIWGFRVTLLIAAGVYLVGWIALRSAERAVDLARPRPST